MKKLLHLCLLVAIFGFAAGCDSDGPTGPEESEDVVIPSETKVLHESSTSKLSSASDDLQTLTFSGDDEKIESVEEGDVIVSEPDDKIPNGMLRKISSIQRNGNSTTFQTAQATLTEAIQRGKFEVEGELTPSDVQSQDAQLKGISFGRPVGKAQARAAQDQFFIEVDNVVLFDNDGNSSTTSDQITADGSIEFAPDYDFSVEIEDFALKQLRFVSNMNTNSELDLETEYELIREEKEKTIATYHFSPIVVPVPPSPFPVVLVPRLDVKVGIEGEVSVGIETGFNYQTDMTAGLEYRSGNWSPVSEFSQSAGHVPLHASAETEAKLYAETPLNFLVYGVAGPFASPRAFLDAEADLTEDPWWTLHWGVEVGAGVKFDALGHTIADYERPGIIGYESLLADAGGPYGSEVPEEGLLVYYPFDGNVLDMSENGYDGTTHGNPEFVQGEERQALRFDGTEDYVRLPDEQGQYPVGNLTLSAWVNVDTYPTSASDEGSYTILELNHASSRSDERNGGTKIAIQESGKVSFVFIPASAQFARSNYYLSESTISLGQWVHIVAVREGSKTKLYLNGGLDKRVDSDTGDIVYDYEDYDDNSVLIGADARAGYTNDPERHFDGGVDEVRIYDRALTEAEVQELYNR